MLDVHNWAFFISSPLSVDNSITLRGGRKNRRKNAGKRCKRKQNVQSILRRKAEIEKTQGRWAVTASNEANGSR